MKEFDFVKFTLIVSVAFIVLLAGAYLWLGMTINDRGNELEQIKRDLARIGELSGEIHLLEDEQRKDRSRQYPEIFAYFHEMAKTAGISSNQDYDFTSRDQEFGEGYVDQEFTLNFRSGREMPRENLTYFIYNVEQSSPRYRLVKAKLQIDENKAKDDLWKATLTFLKRDPMTAEAGAP